MRILLLCLLFLTVPAQAEILVHDDSGQELRLKSAARRIVSLAPHLTENLHAAGAGAYIVGVTDYSDYPASARQLPHIGQSDRIDLEKLLTLEPDLVVAWRSGTSPALLSRLKALGIPVYLSETGRLENIARDIERYGQLAGTASFANQAAARFRQRLAHLRATYSAKPRLRVFYQIWDAPIITVGGSQIISDVIHLCGGENVFGTLAAMAPALNREAVLAARPEVIIASGNNSEAPPWLADWKRWPQLPAARYGHLFFIPPDLIQRHTPRLLDGTEQLCRLLDQARAPISSRTTAP